VRRKGSLLLDGIKKKIKLSMNREVSITVSNREIIFDKSTFSELMIMVEVRQLRKENRNEEAKIGVNLLRYW
jgi:hypothetical protein